MRNLKNNSPLEISSSAASTRLSFHETPFVSQNYQKQKEKGGNTNHHNSNNYLLKPNNPPVQNSPPIDLTLPLNISHTFITNLNTIINNNHIFNTQNPSQSMKNPQLQPSSQSSSSSVKSRCFCKCKKSQCLKLYCECFARLGYCGEGCHCLDCRNSSQHETVRTQAIKDLKSRTFNDGFPEKLQQQMVISNSNPSEQSTSKKITDYKGCNCRRTRCLKKYCDCFNAGSLCGKHCNCSGCENKEHNKGGDEQQKMTFEINTTELNNNPMLRLLLCQPVQLNTFTNCDSYVPYEKQQEQLIYPEKSQNSNNFLEKSQTEFFKQNEKQFPDQGLDYQQSDGINSPLFGNSQPNSIFSREFIGEKDGISQETKQHSEIAEQGINEKININNSNKSVSDSFDDEDNESIEQQQQFHHQEQQQQYQLKLSVMEKKLKQIQLLEAVFIHQETLKQSQQILLPSSRDSYETKIQSFKNHCQGTQEALLEINKDIEVDLQKQAKQQKKIISHRRSSCKEENNTLDESLLF